MTKKKDYYKHEKCYACHGQGYHLAGQHSGMLYLSGFRSHVKACENIPEGAKKLVLFMLSKLNVFMFDLPGKMELSYRRGIQDGEERNNDSKG